MVPSTTLVEVNASSVRRPLPLRVSAAISVPIGTASSTATANESTASDRVAGSRGPTVCETGSCEVIDVPKSPVNRPCR